MLTTEHAEEKSGLLLGVKEFPGIQNQTKLTAGGWPWWWDDDGGWDDGWDADCWDGDCWDGWDGDW